MEARSTDDSLIFARPASRSSSVTRAIITLVGSDRRAMMGGMLLVLYILVALMGPRISRYDLNAPDLDVRMQGPSWAH